MTETIKACADLLGFLDGGTPPVFEDYGADALHAGTVTADQGPHGPVMVTYNFLRTLTAE